MLLFSRPLATDADLRAVATIVRVTWIGVRPEMAEAYAPRRRWSADVGDPRTRATTKALFGPGSAHVGALGRIP